MSSTLTAGDLVIGRVKLTDGSNVLLWVPGINADSTKNALPVAETQRHTYKTASISFAASGDNQVVAAVATKRIKVYAIVVNFVGTVSAKWRSATTDLTGAMDFQAREGFIQSLQPPAFLLQTTAGEALNLNLSGAIGARGWVAYWDDDAT